jgi:hypothetical protein
MPSPSCDGCGDGVVVAADTLRQLGRAEHARSSFVRAVGVNSLEHSTGKVLDSTGFWWGNKKTIPPPHHLLLGAKSKHISSIILCRSGPFFRFRILRADL